MSELVPLLKKGDREAFNELVREYEKQVINIAYGMLSDREDALDAAQEVFVRVYKSIGTFKGQSSLATWIYRITSNICNDMLRKRQRTARTISIYPSDEEEKSPLSELADDRPTPEEALELTERQRAVREGIASLNPDFRAVITLCDIEGLSYEAAAAALSIPHGTVKSRLNRARNALKKKLSEKMELF
ncbi:MAG: sigma-70 family RNA polymerase sigma factor [bacterium]|nr:sigma-70 family RNA polymerase sigma factor [bacterium]